MKRLLLFACCFWSITCCFAQTEAKADYIYSENGFVVKRGTFKTESGNKLHYAGVYTPDGKICIKAWDTGTSLNYPVVAPGTETLAPNSCVIHHFGGYVTIPKSVKYISPDATNGFISIYDDSKITVHKEEKKEENEKRYE